MKKLVLAAMLGIAFQAMADDGVIGYVKTVSGSAAVINAGTPTQAKPGTPIRMNNTLKTAASSTMGIAFKDDTIMSFGPNTEVTVDEFLYAPNKGELKLGAKISKGSMDYVSGVISKLKPDAVAVKTPTGTIGVRGTHFLVKVDDTTEARAEVGPEADTFDPENLPPLLEESAEAAQ